MSGQSSPKTGLPPHRRMRHDRHLVDELAQRMGEGIGRMVRITTITSNQDQPRSNLGNLDDLQSSIDTHGVLEPLLVRRLEGGRYELVSGERRFHAAMAVGLTEVPCIELTVSDQQALDGRRGSLPLDLTGPEHAGSLAGRGEWARLSGAPVGV